MGVGYNMFIGAFPLLSGGRFRIASKHLDNNRHIYEQCECLQPAHGDHQDMDMTYLMDIAAWDMSRKQSLPSFSGHSMRIKPNWHGHVSKAGNNMTPRSALSVAEPRGIMRNSCTSARVIQVGVMRDVDPTQIHTSLPVTALSLNSFGSSTLAS